ncbi:hypothetical protein JTE90_015791 [Oedothorax gibbosus]|uniref:Uncharacterized protein n=1 Tax=Oedothorax gibbosus TaxID=931172 RepID=A0AAV6U027_9ARAC|nr:hypothetical protein JTE90_015791 [Oedothorax gibbosus]
MHPVIHHGCPLWRLKELIGVSLQSQSKAAQSDHTVRCSRSVPRTSPDVPRQSDHPVRRSQSVPSLDVPRVSDDRLID